MDGQNKTITIISFEGDFYQLSSFLLHFYVSYQIYLRFFFFFYKGYLDFSIYLLSSRKLI